MNVILSNYDETYKQQNYTKLKRNNINFQRKRKF